MFSLSYFFFFKQKTAYEMRISDWSSDVCSSDLWGRHSLESAASWRVRPLGGLRRACPVGRPLAVALACREMIPAQVGPQPALLDRPLQDVQAHEGGAAEVGVAEAERQDPLLQRSEAHTSELQSLMRISYAV